MELELQVQCDALKQAFLDGNSEIKAHDVDEDSRFDIYDLTMINLQVNGSKDLKTLYKVTILDVDNNIVSVQYVEKGSDAKTITLEDFGNYAFVGFDKPLKEIYQDTVIKAVYKLK